MIIDSSAIVAVIAKEPDHEQIIRLLAAAPATRIGAPTRLEAGMVLTGRFGPRGRTVLERFLQQGKIETIDFGAEHAQVALDAFAKFGTGRHPAALNFGDCCSYATAALAREPLLCVGDDLPQTDLPVVRLR